MLRQPYLLLLPLLLLPACDDPLATGDVGERVAPQAEIADAAHAAPASGLYFLPPMVRPEPALEGAFDASLLPYLAVEVCAWDGAACAGEPLRFTAEGKGSERLRLEEDEMRHYHVNWDTKRHAAEAGTVHRIRVLAAGTPLGHADAKIVRNGKEAGDVDAATHVAVKQGSTLPIKFWIAQGAVWVVTPDGRDITALDGRVRLVVPQGAVSEPAGVVIRAADDAPADPLLAPGTAFVLMPAALGFAAAAELTLAYDPTSLPADAAEEELRLHRLVDGAWQEVDGSSVDLENDRVTGPVDGLGTYALLAVPASVAARPTTLVLGVAQACALTTDGAAYCWGYNYTGATGLGTRYGVQRTPAPVVGGHTFVSLANHGGGSADHNCGLTAEGAAWCWGANNWGQLGLGTTNGPQQCSDSGGGNCSTAPVAVTGGLTFTALAVGFRHTCGLTADGSAYCWGSNEHRQLGTGSHTGPETCQIFSTIISCSRTPVPVTGGHSFVSLRSGTDHTCGLKENGEAYCWGSNESHRLGVSVSVVGGWSAAPVQVSGGLTFAELALGGRHSCGITTDGSSYCWGRGRYGELGNGAAGFSNLHASPVDVLGGHGFAVLSASTTHTCGVTTEDEAYCWGLYFYGKLGSGPAAVNRLSPWPVSGGHAFSVIAASGKNSCALTPAGEAYCWGDNNFGVVGDGTTTRRHEPVPVSGGHTFVTRSD